MLPFKIQFSIWNFKNKSVYCKKCPASSGTCLQPACNQTVNYQLFKKSFFLSKFVFKNILYQSAWYDWWFVQAHERCVLISAFYTNAVSPAISTSTVTVTPSTVDTTYIYTSCFNITVTTTETFMNNLTTYIPQTTLSYVQSLLTTTMTTMVPTTVVYTTILAPSTVTVQVTPSPTSCQERTTFINITNTKYIEEAMENITKALYVDKKQISSYVRSKTCAEDKRPSAATVGYFGIVFIAVPFGLIFLLDLRSIFAQMRDTANHCQLCYDSDE